LGFTILKDAPEQKEFHERQKRYQNNVKAYWISTAKKLKSWLGPRCCCGLVKITLFL